MSLPNAFNSNTPRPAPQSDAGFILSKPGYDALRANGSNLIFNSSWPSLQIGFETTINNPITGGVTNYPVTHSLRFPPFAEVWTYGPDPAGFGNSAFRMMMAVDSTTLYLSTANLTSFELARLQNATKVNIKCFYLDLSRDIDYILAPGDTFNLPYDDDYGFKVVKPGKDINSRDLRDYTVHSRAQSPLILAVKTEATKVANTVPDGAGGFTPVNVVQYKSNLPFPTWNYGFIKSSAGRYTPAPLESQAYPRTFTDGFTSYVQYSGTDVGATLVILRDPMFAATQETVQY